MCIGDGARAARLGPPGANPGDAVLDALCADPASLGPRRTLPPRLESAGGETSVGVMGAVLSSRHVRLGSSLALSDVFCFVGVGSGAHASSMPWFICLLRDIREAPS